jgi:hypothetical protein
MMSYIYICIHIYIYIDIFMYLYIYTFFQVTKAGLKSILGQVIYQDPSSNDVTDDDIIGIYLYILRISKYVCIYIYIYMYIYVCLIYHHLTM